MLTGGSAVLRVEQVGEETVLAGIVRSVSEAQRSRAPIQKVADRVSAWFVPAVLLAAYSNARGDPERRAGRVAEARQALEKYYKYPDAEEFWVEINQSVQGCVIVRPLNGQ